RVVARLAKQFEVIPVQRDIRIVDVLRRQVDPVMHDLPWATTSFTEPESRLIVGVTATAPSRTLIEPTSPGLHRSSLRRSLLVLPLKRPPSTSSLRRPTNHA